MFLFLSLFIYPLFILPLTDESSIFSLFRNKNSTDPSAYIVVFDENVDKDTVRDFDLNKSVYLEISVQLEEGDLPAFLPDETIFRNGTKYVKPIQDFLMIKDGQTYVNWDAITNALTCLLYTSDAADE